MQRRVLSWSAAMREVRAERAASPEPIEQTYRSLRRILGGSAGLGQIAYAKAIEIFPQIHVEDLLNDGRLVQDGRHVRLGAPAQAA